MKDWSTDPVAALHAAIAEYVEEAKQKLKDDDKLTPVILLTGEGEHITMDIEEVPPHVAKVIARNLRVAKPTLRIAFHIQLAYTLLTTVEFAAESIDTNPNARLSFVVHGTHPDVGLMAAHVPLKRIAAHEFEFGETEWPEPKLLQYSSLLWDLWGERHLNS